jgi:hypothetical protein
MDLPLRLKADVRSSMSEGSAVDSSVMHNNSATVSAHLDLQECHRQNRSQFVHPFLRGHFRGVHQRQHQFPDGIVFVRRIFGGTIGRRV